MPTTTAKTGNSPAAAAAPPNPWGSSLDKLKEPITEIESITEKEIQRERHFNPTSHRTTHHAAGSL